MARPSICHGRHAVGLPDFQQRLHLHRGKVAHREAADLRVGMYAHQTHPFDDSQLQVRGRERRGAGGVGRLGTGRDVALMPFQMDPCLGEDSFRRRFRQASARRRNSRHNYRRALTSSNRQSQSRGPASAAEFLAVPTKRVISIASPAPAILVDEPFFPSPTTARLPALLSLSIVASAADCAVRATFCQGGEFMNAPEVNSQTTDKLFITRGLHLRVNQHSGS